LAAASTVLAVYASSNGLAVAPLVAVMAFVLPVGRVARIVLAATAAFSVGTYFVGYTVAKHPEYHASLGSRDGVLQFLDYVTTFLGSIGQTNSKVLVVLGIVSLVVWSAVVLALVARARSGCPLDPSALALLMLATLAIATAAMTALGRAGIGPRQALSSRYATWSVLFWVPLAGAAYRLADAAARPVAKIATVVVAAGLLGLSYRSGRYFVDYARQNAAIIDAVAPELRAGHILPENLIRIHPRGDEIRPSVEFLRAHKLSIFAD
jgi:hypothetical protein